MSIKEKKLVGSLSETDKENLNLINYQDIEGTPFVIVDKEVEGEEGRKYFAMFGKYQMHEAFESRSEAIKWAKKVTWNKILQLIIAVVTEQNNLNKE